MNTNFDNKLFKNIDSCHSWEVWLAWAKSPNTMGELIVLEQTEGFQYYPELTALVDCPQDEIWHPEGDVWRHTKYVVAEAAQVSKEREFSTDEHLVLLFAALCHDFGKPDTTVHEESGRITSRDHGKKGLLHVRSFLSRIDAPDWLIEQVEPLVAYHLAYASVKGEPTYKAVRRMKKRLYPASLDLWEALIEADASGRPPLPKKRPAKLWLEVEEEISNMGEEKQLEM